jgi:hypothetical protein
MTLGRSAAAVVVLCLSGSFARAAVGAIEWMLPGETVRATLSSAGEKKTVAFAGVEGSTLDVRATAPDGSRVVPHITVIAPDGVPAIVGDTNPKGTGRAQVTGLALGATGIWRIGVESPPGRGGAFVLSAKARVPLRFAWARTVAAGSDDYQFAAAPGGTVAISVDSGAGSAFDPSVELIAPSGAIVAKTAGAKGRAAIAHAALRELGRYTVRVSGGPGAFTARAVVRAAKRRRLSYRDVESSPSVLGFSPGTTPNQLAVTLYLDGVGFTDRQTISIGGAAGVVASAPAQPFGYAKAAALLDLADVAPGSYELRVTTPGGRVSVAPARLVVTNRAPTVASVTPADAGAAKSFPLDVLGSGFDSAASVFLRRASDGAAVPLSVISRSGHEGIATTVSPPPYFTGACDIEVRDPDGGRAIAAGGVDLLGYTAAPAALHEITAAVPDLYVYDAAYDETRGRVLLAMRDGLTRAVFVLFDAATLSVTDTLTIDAADLGGGHFDHVRVAWDGVGGTFALCVCSTASPAYGVLRVVSAGDIHQTLLQTQMSPAESDHMSRIQAAANRDDGGYLVVWDQFDQAFGRRIRAQSVGVAQTIDTSTQSTVAWSPAGNIADPVTAYQGAGKFVVAWASLTADGFDYAIRATQTDTNGAQVAGAGPYVTATSHAWTATARPDLAVNPADGTMLLTYWYSEGVVYRPASQRLAPKTAAPGPSSKLDLELPILGGGPTSVVWNATRGEFVVVVVTYSNRATLRRVNADGSLRPAPVVESYEGTSAVLYTAAAPGTLGLARGFDGVADDVHDTATTKMQSIAGPLR